MALAPASLVKSLSLKEGLDEGEQLGLLDMASISLSESGNSFIFAKQQARRLLEQSADRQPLHDPLKPFPALIKEEEVPVHLIQEGSLLQFVQQSLPQAVFWKALGRSLLFRQPQSGKVMAIKLEKEVSSRKEGLSQLDWESRMHHYMMQYNDLPIKTAPVQIENCYVFALPKAQIDDVYLQDLEQSRDDADGTYQIVTRKQQYHFMAYVVEEGAEGAFTYVDDIKEEEDYWRALELNAAEIGQLYALGIIPELTALYHNGPERRRWLWFVDMANIQFGRVGTGMSENMFHAMLFSNMRQSGLMDFGDLKTFETLKEQLFEQHRQVRQTIDGYEKFLDPDAFYMLESLGEAMLSLYLVSIVRQLKQWPNWTQEQREQAKWRAVQGLNKVYNRLFAAYLQVEEAQVEEMLGCYDRERMVEQMVAQGLYILSGEYVQDLAQGQIARHIYPRGVEIELPSVKDLPIGQEGDFGSVQRYLATCPRSWAVVLVRDRKEVVVAGRHLGWSSRLHRTNTAEEVSALLKLPVSKVIYREEDRGFGRTAIIVDGEDLKQSDYPQTEEFLNQMAYRAALYGNAGAANGSWPMQSFVSMAVKTAATVVMWKRRGNLDGLEELRLKAHLDDLNQRTDFTAKNRPLIAKMWVNYVRLLHQVESRRDGEEKTIIEQLLQVESLPLIAEIVRQLSESGHVWARIFLPLIENSLQGDEVEWEELSIVHKLLVFKLLAQTRQFMPPKQISLEEFVSKLFVIKSGSLVELLEGLQTLDQQHIWFMNELAGIFAEQFLKACANWTDQNAPDKDELWRRVHVIVYFYKRYLSKVRKSQYLCAKDLGRMWQWMHDQVEEKSEERLQTMADLSIFYIDMMDRYLRAKEMTAENVEDFFEQFILWSNAHRQIVLKSKKLFQDAFCQLRKYRTWMSGERQEPRMPLVLMEAVSQFAHTYAFQGWEDNPAKLFDLFRVWSVYLMPDLFEYYLKALIRQMVLNGYLSYEQTKQIALARGVNIDEFRRQIVEEIKARGSVDDQRAYWKNRMVFNWALQEDKETVYTEMKQWLALDADKIVLVAADLCACNHYVYALRLLVEHKEQWDLSTRLSVLLNLLWPNQRKHPSVGRFKHLVQLEKSSPQLFKVLSQLGTDLEEVLKISGEQIPQADRAWWEHNKAEINSFMLPRLQTQARQDVPVYDTQSLLGSYALQIERLLGVVDWSEYEVTYAWDRKQDPGYVASNQRSGKRIEIRLSSSLLEFSPEVQSWIVRNELLQALLSERTHSVEQLEVASLWAVLQLMSDREFEKFSQELSRYIDLAAEESYDVQALLEMLQLLWSLKKEGHQFDLSAVDSLFEQVRAVAGDRANLLSEESVRALKAAA